MASLLYSVASTGAAVTPDLGLPPELAALAPPAAPAKDVDDTSMFVSTVRALGFAMSLDVAEIANTVNASPVTVLDVVAITTRDGGALKKMSDFAEQLETFPDANSIESASRNVRQLLDNTSNDLRVVGNDDSGKKQRTAETQRDPHNYADAIQQMIDGVKDLIKQTENTGGGLNSALTAFISPDGHTARYLVQTNLYPFGTEAMDQIHVITDAARGPHPDAMFKQASISASGVTAMLRDTRAYYGKDISLIIAMTILIVFIILVALLRAVVAPLYLIASVVISYLSAFGIGVFVFQFILGQKLTWSIPGLTFIVLVAMGADYNLLLISRLREESPHGIRSGVIRTVRSTGGVITAAGVIFAASMFGMMFASISTLVQAGFIIGTGFCWTPSWCAPSPCLPSPCWSASGTGGRPSRRHPRRVSGSPSLSHHQRPKRRAAPPTTRHAPPARQACQERSRHRRVALVSRRERTTHSATRRVHVGVRP